MKAAFKWRIQNGLYAYITDESGNGEPFAYDIAQQSRIYSGGTVIPEYPVDEGAISTSVSRMAKQTYTDAFNKFKQFINSKYPQVSLLDVIYYYNIENDECTASASALKCSATDIVFDAEANTGDTLGVTVTNEQTDPNSGEELRYKLDFTFPGDMGSHRPIKVNGKNFLGNDDTPLVLSAGTNVTLTTGSTGVVKISAAGGSNTDEKVMQSSVNVNKEFPILASAKNISSISSGSCEKAIYDTGVNINPNKHSIANGEKSIAYGVASHASGIWCYAQRDGQTVVGKYNYNDKAEGLFVVGCGTGNDERANALEVYNQNNYGLVGIIDSWHSPGAEFYYDAFGSGSTINITEKSHIIIGLEHAGANYDKCHIYILYNIGRNTNIFVSGGTFEENKEVICIVNRTDIGNHPGAGGLINVNFCHDGRQISTEYVYPSSFTIFGTSGSYYEADGDVSKYFNGHTFKPNIADLIKLSSGMVEEIPQLDEIIK